MAEGPADRREMFKQAGKKALVLGHTGETGRALIKLLAQQQLFAKVTLVGRRMIPLNESERPEFVSDACVFVTSFNLIIIMNITIFTFTY